MKRFFVHAFVAPLYAASALLLCFGSCQSSDNAKIGEGASVASLPLTARIGETSSRVGMSDTYGGAFSCYWNGDKFDVHQKYVKDGTVQNMTSLEFGTTATNGASATFSYTGTDGYRYNPGARLYAFSKGTNGGYTATVSDDGTSTLTVPALASQNGTLVDCATYDALYGSADVDYSTGLPESLLMHHLFGMMNLHLTSSSFSTSYPVTVTLTSSVANILPGNTGNATLKADGSLNVLTGSWGTSWSATITPTTAGVVDVYFMTWPFTSSTGTLTVSCSDASDNVYTARPITLSNFGLAAAQLKSKPLAITSTPFVLDSSKLYAWDATDYQPVTINTGKAPTNANATTVASSSTDYSSRALYACKNCPNYNAITWYLSVPYYWDDGKQDSRGGNATIYTLADGTTTKVGMWFKQQLKITGFSSTSTFTGTMISKPVALSGMDSSAISALKLQTDYFFLPAAGYTDYETGAFSEGGTEGYYWSSTPYFETTGASFMGFFSGGVTLTNGSRAFGLLPWTAQ